MKPWWMLTEKEQVALQKRLVAFMNTGKFPQPREESATAINLMNMVLEAHPELLSTTTAKE